MAISRDRTKSDKERNDALEKARQIQLKINDLTLSQAETSKNAAVVTLQTALRKQGYGGILDDNVLNMLYQTVQKGYEDGAERFKQKFVRLNKEINATKNVPLMMGGDYFEPKEVDPKKVAELNEYLQSSTYEADKLAYYFKEMPDDEKSMLAEAIKLKNVWHQTNAEIAETTLLMNNTEAKINGSYKSNVKAGGTTIKGDIELKEGTIAYINKQIRELTKKWENETEQSVRIGFQAAIEALKREKHILELEYELTTKQLDVQGLPSIKGRNVTDDLKSGAIKGIKPIE
jgi:hypothetical protein